LSPFSRPRKASPFCFRHFFVHPTVWRLFELTFFVDHYPFFLTPVTPPPPPPPPTGPQGPLFPSPSFTFGRCLPFFRFLPPRLTPKPAFFSARLSLFFTRTDSRVFSIPRSPSFLFRLTFIVSQISSPLSLTHPPFACPPKVALFFPSRPP